MEVSRVPLLQGVKKEKGHTRYTLLPTVLVTEADILHHNKGPGAHGRKRVGTEPPQSYEAVLQATCQKALETTEALHNNLERLGNEHRDRSQAHTQEPFEKSF